MNNNLFNLSLEELKALHVDESKSLNTQLLNGADWEEVQNQRKFISDISKIIVRKESDINQDPSKSNLRKVT